MRGHDLRNFCRDLLAHFRDLLVTKVSGNEELLESAVCEPAELQRQAALFSEFDLVRFFHSLAETETKLRAATQPRYQLEIGIVKLMELRGVESINEILQRLATLETNAVANPLQRRELRQVPAAVQVRSRPSVRLLVQPDRRLRPLPQSHPRSKKPVEENSKPLRRG
jgi:DNA polymerase III gamma/tau subunit